MNINFTCYALDLRKKEIFCFGDDIAKRVKDINDAQKIQGFMNKTQKNLQRPSLGARIELSDKSLQRSKPVERQRKRPKSRLQRENVSQAKKILKVNFKPQAGSLQFYDSEWKKFTSDPWVLNTVQFGYEIEFWGTPIQRGLPSQEIFQKKKPILLTFKFKNY